MWSTHSEPLNKGRSLKVMLQRGSASVSFEEVLKRWQHDDAFRSFFIAALADAPFSAFRWETPPISSTLVTRAFEFVLQDSPGLAANPDRDAFTEHFADAEANQDVLSFPNLGNDATLIVPCPLAADSAYGHLAAFVREAPETQKHSLWAMVGKVAKAKLGKDPIWLSTAGAGVSWLHVRLDKRPKYYGYAPYRDV
jgi:hypothetical protein